MYNGTICIFRFIIMNKKIYKLKKNSVGCIELFDENSVSVYLLKLNLLPESLCNYKIEFYVKIECLNFAIQTKYLERKS